MEVRAELDAVSLVRGGRQVFEGLSLQIPATGVTAVVGPSGAGKSSLLRLLVRLEEADQGRVLVDGVHVREHDPLALRRRIALVAQTPVMLPGSVADNLVYGLQPQGVAVPDALTRAGLSAAFADRRASELSGGEAMRVAIARALARGPAALLLDEPTAALDVAVRDALADLLRGLATSGLTVVLVTHDDELALRLADRVVRLDAGHVIDFGTTREVLGR